MTDDNQNAGTAGTPAAGAAGTTSAKTARKPPKSRREIELEIKNAQLEDELTGAKEANTELEKFIADLAGKPGGKNPAAGKQPAQPAPAAGDPAPAATGKAPAKTGWDWEGFAANPL